MAEAYCVKDKRRVEIASPHEVVFRNGRKAIQGVCPICGTKVTRITGIA